MKRWSEEELQHLKWHYHRIPVPVLAEHLKKGVRAVYCKANRLDLRRPRLPVEGWRKVFLRRGDDSQKEES